MTTLKRLFSNSDDVMVRCGGGEGSSSYWSTLNLITFLEVDFTRPVYGTRNIYLDTVLFLHL